MRAWGLTDMGGVRTQNQDSYYIDLIPENKLSILVVCDGMGGAKAGNIASEMAVGAYVEELKNELRPQMTAKQLEKAARRALESANEQVHDKSKSSSDYTGMGTTLVSCIVAGNTALSVNVGDSRAYLINDRGIEQITRDHSMVEELVERGEITREEAKKHPSKNLITRALGTGSRVRGDFYPFKLKNGDNILLCSDGVSNILSDQELLYVVIHNEEKETCCQRLINMVKERGAPDNATVVVYEK